LEAAKKKGRKGVSRGRAIAEAVALKMTLGTVISIRRQKN